MYTYIFIILILLIFMSKRENFSHRAILQGITNKTRNNYYFDYLKDQYPIDYWKTKPSTVYDRDIKKYHSKRFNKIY